MINILMVDDHQIVIDGIKSLLQHDEHINIAGEANNGKQAIALLDQNNYDLAILDVSMPGMGGAELTTIIKGKYPELKVLILTMHNEDEVITDLVANGADGYILKDAGRDQLMEAIEDLMSGKNHYSDEVTKTIIDNYTKTSRKKVEEPIVEISKREQEVLKLIAQEFTSKQIAKELHIEVSTVETHRRNLISKTKVKSSLGLVRFAVEKGYIEG